MKAAVGRKALALIAFVCAQLLPAPAMDAWRPTSTTIVNFKTTSVKSNQPPEAERKMKVDIDAATIPQYIESVKPEFEARLKELVDIPSVSMDPAHKKDIERCAGAAAEILKMAGFKSEIVKTRGNPVVFGEWTAGDSYPTVTVYNHLDVQPAERAQWKTPPFEMSIENGTYRGRGTTDDKGPALTVLYAANYVARQKLPLNIKFIWELEEEIGSPSFEEFLDKNKEKLKTDSVIVSDTIWVSRDRPAIPYGLRGLQGLLLRLKTGSKDVHSGLTGGLARNPVGELSQLISECYDARTGKVLIPGFYDNVREPSDKELDDFVKSGFTVEGFMKAHELASVRTHDAKEGARRIWAHPTFEVHGIAGGYSGPGIKTIVPHNAEAKISVRLVPDQDPEKVADLIIKFVKERSPDVEVIKEGSLKPYLGSTTGPFADAARQAMVYAFGKEPAFTREGGSIGAVVSMSQVLGVPVNFLGLSLPEHGYHAINENYDWQQASGGVKMFIKYFELVSQIK